MNLTVFGLHVWLTALIQVRLWWLWFLWPFRYYDQNWKWSGPKVTWSYL